MNDTDIEKQANQALDKSTASLSPETRQRLFEARQSALSEGTGSYRKPALVGFALAASFSAILLVNSMQKHEDADIPQLAQSKMEDLILLSSFDETDMEIVENLEFSYWLTEQLNHETEPETHTPGELHNG